ncbi:hypothetical protein GALMADRAFT_152139 [Galerina marginata CBS 339.88]|uniref:F-box domain-containing protein n=1 Tax=Galerina marginata (strain CBS 339.88) TaxID=685588 RepID=A0A067TIZ0_GALM3|nr:hypothetical protein GALMADRAFT_152139 [Galerina marginata CBS 339.88]
MSYVSQDRPMPHLPVETWGTIFQFVEDTTSSRIKLLRVSQSWRRIATATPQLWSRLYIHTTNLVPVRFFLKHSRNLPLDMHIRLLDSSAKDTDALTTVLAEHLSRMRLLEIQISEQELANKFVARLGHGQPAPLLESLCIQVDNPSCDPVRGLALLNSAFRSTPCLARLILPAYPLPHRSSPLFSSSVLTDLTLDAIPFGANTNEYAIFFTIKSVTNLQSITLKSSASFSYCNTSTFRFPNISTPHLISVDISAPGWGLHILDAFHAPLLTSVRLAAPRGHRYRDWTAVYTEAISTSLRLLSQRSPLVKQLELCGTVLHHPEEDYRWLFGTAFPLMEVMRFERTDITDALMMLGYNCMPGLKTLELSGCKGISGPGLLSFLQTRANKFRLVLEACPHVTEDAVQALLKVTTLQVDDSRKAG